MSYMRCKCGATMVPLFSSVVCPNNCDKKQKPKDACPRCRANDIEPFPLPNWDDAWHCWDCGSVFDSED